VENIELSQNLEFALEAYFDSLEPATLALLFSLLLLLQIVKGFALWKAAQNSSTAWFIALLFLNTLGILEVVYIFLFSKRERKEAEDGE